jgi:hypothetical protein
MSKSVWSGVLAAGIIIGVPFSSTVAAETATANVNATATVAAKARLEVTGVIAFADQDPQSTPVINSAAIDLVVKARTSATETVTLTVIAGDDFDGPGSEIIPIANLGWSAGGSGFVGGTASKTAAQSVGSWTGSGQHTGTQTYNLVNSWNYAIGTYTVTLTYTLTAP